METFINSSKIRYIFIILVVMIALSICASFTGFFLVRHHIDELISELVITILLITSLWLFLLYVRKVEKKATSKARILERINRKLRERIKEKEMLQNELVQAQKMEAIGRISGGIAHDFNNVLTVISGYTSLILMEMDEKDPDYDDLKQIEKAVRRASALSEQLLLINRKTEYTPKTINLNDEVRNAVPLIKPSLSKSITTEILLENDLPSVYADPHQIEQMIVNLVLNARDAMPDGGILTLTTRSIEISPDFATHQRDLYPGEYVKLTVSDTGCGMDKEVQQHIFEPFFTTKDTDKGAGLGLSIVFNIVKNCGGSISCYSVPKIGTTFQVYLPVKKYLHEEPKNSLKSSEPGNPHPYGKRKTILLVDDEKEIRRTTQMALEEKAYTVIMAENGKQALTVYKKYRTDIDLVIMDYRMPVMNGYECMIELYKINPDLKIIVSSGSNKGGDMENAITLSAGYLQKPYEMKDLFHCVKEVLTK